MDEEIIDFLMCGRAPGHKVLCYYFSGHENEHILLKSWILSPHNNFIIKAYSVTNIPDYLVKYFDSSNLNYLYLSDKVKTKEIIIYEDEKTIEYYGTNFTYILEKENIILVMSHKTNKIVMLLKKFIKYKLNYTNTNLNIIDNL